MGGSGHFVPRRGCPVQSYFFEKFLRESLTLLKMSHPRRINLMQELIPRTRDEDEDDNIRVIIIGLSGERMMVLYHKTKRTFSFHTMEQEQEQNRLILHRHVQLPIFRSLLGRVAQGNNKFDELTQVILACKIQFMKSQHDEIIKTIDGWIDGLKKSSVCPICYHIGQGFQELQCGHSLCRTCFKVYLTKIAERWHCEASHCSDPYYKYCPLCRKELTDEFVVSHLVDYDVQLENPSLPGQGAIQRATAVPPAGGTPILTREDQIRVVINGAGVRRAEAIVALNNHHWDIVSAVISLTM